MISYLFVFKLEGIVLV